MSAWLLFAAMGFYPVNPASGEYMIGSPMYSLVGIRLQNGKTFHVEAENVSATNLYIQSAMLDGKPLNDPVITWEQIQSGATLKFRMGPKPSRWGSDWQPAAIPSE
jgi:putative alpha-1,2-mannosidase